MRTLITAANSGKAYRLKSKLPLIDVILGDYLDLPAFMLASEKMIRLPHPDVDAYTHDMLTLCLDKQINTVYALRMEEIEALKSVEQLFNEYGITVLFVK